MRAARLLLFLLGAASAAYGGRLLLPQLGPTLPWLIGGPVLHDLVVAPLAGLVGLALGRLVTDRLRLTLITFGLLASATLLLIAAPLLWRPPSAPPNPGLPDRDHPLGLAVGLAVVWAAVALALVVATIVNRRGASRRTDTR
ncbi:hypothetical protein O7634_29525 [Micromonospora sp. WMMD1120]|uniref:hypothetical protein n=1 Tax=Micromonospora sp. WMMD1120 TaxID=3016106 RepID=UPI002415E438|nr:hypothetical protein [Micromonospora sp. WMMD1120]MDG4810919.1 hypothetical protein [Micromonospora sp. WMMD1120]